MSIKHVVDTGNEFRVYGENNRDLGSKSKDSNEELIAWGQDFFVTKKSNSSISTYQADCYHIASMSKYGLEEYSVSVNNMGYILLKSKSYNSVESYTKDLQKIG